MSNSHSQPWSFRVSYWYSFLFSLTFLLYGGVSIVLSVLDREYSTFMASFVFAVVGALLVLFASAYKDLKKWGWYGVIAANVFVVLFAVIDLIGDFGQYESLILFLLSAGALVLLLTPDLRSYISHTAKN